MCILPGLLHFTSRYGFPNLNAVYSLTKIKYGQEVSNGRSYQQNWKEEPKCFNLMCVVRLFIKISTVVAFSKKVTQICNYQRIQTKKLQYRKFGIAGLKSSLKATEKYAYCLGYLHFTSRYGFPTTYHFYLKSG